MPRRLVLVFVDWLTSPDADAELQAVREGKVPRRIAASLFDRFDENKNKIMDAHELNRFVHALAKSYLFKKMEELATEKNTVEEVSSLLNSNKGSRVKKDHFMLFFLEHTQLPCRVLQEWGVTVRIPISQEDEPRCDQISKFWERYDKGGRGYIEEDGVKDLMKDLVKAECVDSDTVLDTYSDDVEKANRDLTRLLDMDLNGIIERGEFINRITNGFKIELKKPTSPNPLRLFDGLKSPDVWNGHVIAPIVKSEEMLNHSKRALINGLTKLPDMLEKDAVENFSDLHGWMKDRDMPEDQRVDLASAIVRRARKVGMRNEIYVQLMKQLTNNPSMPSRERGWRLFLQLVADEVQPSEELKEYVCAFVKNAIAAGDEGEQTSLAKQVIALLGDEPRNKRQRR